jgi:hypothetical protein
MTPKTTSEALTSQSRPTEWDLPASDFLRLNGYTAAADRLDALQPPGDLEGGAHQPATEAEVTDEQILKAWEGFSVWGFVKDDRVQRAREILALRPSPHQPATAGAEPSLRDRLQKQCVDWNAYWRASDSHGVELTKPQAIELLCNALGVEVEIKDNGCVVCDGTGLIGDQRCPDCADSAKPAGEEGKQ